MIPIPSQKTKKWTQTNTGEILGEIFASKNINFDQFGYAKLAKRSTPVSYGVSNFGVPIAIWTLTGTTYFILTSSGVFTYVIGGTPTASSGGPTVSIKHDAVVWYKRLYVSTDNDVHDFDGTNWQDASISLNTGNHHPMCVHEGLNELAIGDANVIYLYSSASSTSHSLVTTVTLPSNYEVRWIRYSNNLLYIGTRSLNGDEAMIFTSDGVSVFPINGYPLPSSSFAFSGTIYKGVLLVFSSKGQLLRFNGSGFTEMAHLPVYDTPYTWYGGSSYSEGKIQQRGMCVKGDRIFINLNGYVDAPGNIQLPNQPSGLWVYDPAIGLYHKSSPTIDPITYVSSFTSVNNSTGVITVSGGYGNAPTGTKVFIGTTNITGLISNAFYWIINLSSTTFQLASSYSNAKSGTYIPLTANSTGNMTVHNDLSFGQSSDTEYEPGCVSLVSDIDSNLEVNSGFGYIASELFYGAGEVLDPTLTGQFTLQTLSLGENRGYFITTKIFSQDILDWWTDLFVKYNNLFQGNDKIFVKFRQVDRMNYPLSVQSTITWTAANTFTTTADLSSVQAGDEVEICSGRGQGCSAQISSLTLSTGTWTVVLDENIPGATNGDESFDLLFQNWSKIAIITMNGQDSVFGFNKATLLNAKASKWVQFKIVLRGTSEPFIEELQAINKAFMPSE